MAVASSAIDNLDMDRNKQILNPVVLLFVKKKSTRTIHATNARCYNLKLRHRQVLDMNMAAAKPYDQIPYSEMYVYFRDSQFLRTELF